MTYHCVLSKLQECGFLWVELFTAARVKYCTVEKASGWLHRAKWTPPQIQKKSQLKVGSTFVFGKREKNLFARYLGDYGICSLYIRGLLWVKMSVGVEMKSFWCNFLWVFCLRSAEGALIFNLTLRSVDEENIFLFHAQMIFCVLICQAAPPLNLCSMF